MKKFTLMFFAAAIAVLFFPMKSMAIDATWTAANQGYENGQEVTAITIAEGITGTLEKAESNNPPKYYNTGTSLRMYAGNKLTITSTQALTKISFEFDTNNGAKIPDFTVSAGAIKIAESGEAGTWTGNATEIIFIVPNVTGTQSRIQKIIIGEGGAEIVPEPVDPVEGELVKLPAGVTPEVYTLDAKGYAFDENDDPFDYNVLNEIQVAFNGNDVYVQGLSYYFPEGWVKGTIQGEKATFKSGQLYGSDEEGPTYFVGTNEAGNIIDVVFDYDPETRTFTTDNYILENGVTNEVSCYLYFYQATIYPGAPVMPDLVTLPEGVTAGEYHFIGYNNYHEESIEYPMQVAFDGNDIYMQGLSIYIPDAWVKGTLTDGKAVFEEGQFIGVYESIYGDYDIFFDGATFLYDAESGKFTSEEGFQTSSSTFLWDEFSNVVITKVIEREATPATPTVISLEYDSDYGYSIIANVPLTDTEGNYMSSSKLSYQIYYEKDGKTEAYVLKPTSYEKLTEEMTIIPYSFTDEWDIYTGCSEVYLYGDIESWTKVGVKAIYTGGGKTHESAIGWLNIDWEAMGIADVNADSKAVRFFDLQGRQVNESSRGLLIKQVRQADGSTKSIKVVRK